MSDDAIKTLEDAYQMGRTDATLKTDDHKVLMPKMQKKLAQQLRQYIDKEIIGTDENPRQMPNGEEITMPNLQRPKIVFRNELRAEQRQKVNG